jgi:hypothetical protein
MFASFSLSCCFAQTNPTKYLYEGHCEIPDFAALAVLEKQYCPNPVAIKNYEYYEYKEYENQICTSRYRIIRILDAAPDMVKKEYIEAKEKPVLFNFRHRPMLIFGKYKNGIIQIEGQEEMSEYFDYFNSEGFYIEYQNLEFSPLVGHLGEVYSLHSIGTPYYSLKNLDSLDMIYYNEYLMPLYKLHVEAAGKNFGELLLRLTQNREPIKAVKIKNEFAALGAIKNIRLASDSKRANLYELNLVIETIFKNDAKIDSNITIFIDKNRLPTGWGCMPLNSLYKKPFYLFGNSKDGSLLVDSLISTRDKFIFGDTIYDISMGFPFKEMLAYFLPSNISLEEFEFGRSWKHLFAAPENSAEIQKGIFSASAASVPECLRKDITNVAIKWEDFFGKNSYRRRILKNGRYNREVKSLLWGFSFLNEFRCRRPDSWPIKKDEICVRCHTPFTSNGEGVWGNKW